MYAILSTDAAVGVGSNETLQYTPPGGSRLIGGSVNVSFYADGGGYNASGTAVAYTPEYAYNGSNVFTSALGVATVRERHLRLLGSARDSGGRGGDLYLSAGCGGAKATPATRAAAKARGRSCACGGDLLLSNEATQRAAVSAARC